MHLRKYVLVPIPPATPATQQPLLTVRQIRLHHSISSTTLAQAAGVTPHTLYRLEIGCTVTSSDATRVLIALSWLARHHYRSSDIRDLHILPFESLLEQEKRSDGAI